MGEVMDFLKIYMLHVLWRTIVYITSTRIRKRSWLGLRKVATSNLFALGRLGRGRSRGRSRGRRRLGRFDAERFFMNIAHLFRSASVEGHDGLAEGRSKSFRVILERDERGKRGRRRGDTSYATFEYPFCSSTLFTRV
jgi:hypothetical protein